MGKKDGKTKDRKRDLIGSDHCWRHWWTSPMVVVLVQATWEGKWQSQPRCCHGDSNFTIEVAMEIWRDEKMGIDWVWYGGMMWLEGVKVPIYTGSVLNLFSKCFYSWKKIFLIRFLEKDQDDKYCDVQRYFRRPETINVMEFQDGHVWRQDF